MCLQDEIPFRCGLQKAHFCRMELLQDELHSSWEHTKTIRTQFKGALQHSVWVYTRSMNLGEVFCLFSLLLFSVFMPYYKLNLRIVLVLQISYLALPDSIKTELSGICFVLCFEIFPSKVLLQYRVLVSLLGQRVSAPLWLTLVRS